jgi:hypothetical protein
MSKRLNYNFDNIPTKWSEMTLNKFIGLKRLHDECDGKEIPTLKLLAYITDKEEKYFKDMPALLVEKLITSLTFLREELPSKIDNTVIIDDVIYKINTEEHLKFQEFVDTQTVLEADKYNLPAILGILCRKEGEVYDDEYIANELPNRIEMFGNANMVQIQPLLNFFLQCSLKFIVTTPQFLTQVSKEVNHILQDYENLIKNGDGKKRFSIWQKIKLRKLKKLAKSILQQS